MLKKIDYSVIVPAYHEGQIIAASLDSLAAYLKADQTRYGATEVIVVAADSNDHTAAIARQKSNLFTSFQLIEPGVKIGKGRDVRAGVLAAKGSYVLFLDADLATSPKYIKLAFDKLEETGADFLIGERSLSTIHNSLSRRLSSIVSNRLIRLLAVPGVNDSQCGFKVFKKQVARQLFQPLETLQWDFDIEILVRARALGYKMVNLKISDWHDPKLQNMGLVGESNLRAYVKTLIDLLVISRKRFSGYYRLK